MVDAADKVLGRLASQIAHRLRGKHKPTFTPGVPMGDYVVVINAQQITVTGSRIRRKDEVIWEKPFLTGEGNMSHTLANLEYHHFKYEPFRKPGDLHIHYYGADAFSFGEGVRVEAGAA